MKCHRIYYAAALLCAAVNANATLTSVDNGLGVYDSGINATWTSDANLLGTLESQQGYSTVVNAIIVASPVIHDTPNMYDDDSGIYNVSASDFGSGGAVNWFGAEAFVNYLNHINYGNSSQWALPTTVDSLDSKGYAAPSSSQLAELFYSELGGTAGSPIPTNSLFSNELAYPYSEPSRSYWSGTETSDFPITAWSFSTYNGGQYANFKPFQRHAWAVSPGQLNAVPIPGAVWLFGTGLVGMLGFKRRVHAG